MDFVANQTPQREAMLREIGVERFEDLLSDIPQDLQRDAPKDDDGLSEMEGMRLMERIGEENTAGGLRCYLGAGAYDHHVPALVPAICQKSEFLTSYTPYQAEASQGMLQIIFEFQSAICALTGLDVANASVYDGACACAEALLMAARIQKRRQKLLVAGTVNPRYLAVIRQYLSHVELDLCVSPITENGTVDQDWFSRNLDEGTAGLLLQSPNYFGLVEDVKPLTALARKKGIISTLCANPLAYGLFPSARELGFDIAVGDGQPFGLPLQFGGPYVGYMATRQDLVRQLPGRIVGETVDIEGKRGFVLTLQAREQHIRREKATSNICSNQSLAALASLVSMLWYGKEGVSKLARTNFQRANYLRARLSELPGLNVPTPHTIFNEFVVGWPKGCDEVLRGFEEQGILAGVPLDANRLLVAVTETKTKEDLDRYVELAKEIAAP